MTHLQFNTVHTGAIEIQDIYNMYKTGLVCLQIVLSETNKMV